MAKALSVASWNVEHFKGDPSRTNRVISFIKQQYPDVTGIYEIKSKTVFSEVTAPFPNYNFQITEGPQTQEILIGFKSTLSVFMIQKIEFKAGTTRMRPRLLATISIDGTL